MMKYRYLWLLIVAAFLLRLVLAFSHQSIEIDGVYYARMGENLWSGHGLVDVEGRVNTVFMALYPVLLGLVNLVVGNLEFAARFVAVVFGALLIIPVFFIARRLFSEKVAWFAAGLTVVYPALSYIASIAYVDALFLFLLFMALWCSLMVVDRPREWTWWSIMAFFSALSYLCRPESLLFFVLWGVVLFFLLEKRLVVRRWLVMLVIFVVVMLPYVLLVYQSTGDVSLSSKGFVIYKFRSFEPFSPAYESNIFGLNTAKDDILLNPYTVKGSLVGEILAHPAVFLERYTSSLLREVFLTLPMLFPLVFLSLLGLWLVRRDRRQWLLVSVVLLPLVFYPVFWVEARYLLVVLPILFMWCGVAWFWLAHRFKKLPWRLALVVLFLVLLVANVFAHQLVDKRFEKADPPVNHKEAGLWLHSQGSALRVMERKPWVSFYSGGL